MLFSCPTHSQQISNTQHQHSKIQRAVSNTYRQGSVIAPRKEKEKPIADLVSVMHAIQRPRYRSAVPQHADPSSGFLSLNIFVKEKQKTLCKTNCREIEVVILDPASSFSLPPPNLPSEDDFGVEAWEGLRTEEGSKETLERVPAAMFADQERPETSPFGRTLSHDDDDNNIGCLSTSAFPFMNLPLELRLKIYAYLLPPRHHTIVTQLPHNGFFYNTSTVPRHSAQSFYPFGRKAPNNLTTYKVLNSNFRAEFPESSIYPEILRVSKKFKEEAEEVLYAGKGVVWDFGIHLEALKAFWGDRSLEARRCVRDVRIAREIPSFDGKGDQLKAIDPQWVSLCDFFKTELTGLRTLDLTIWCSSGETSSFPLSASESVSSLPLDWRVNPELQKTVKEEELRKWRQWEWTHDLLKVDALRQARITWWGGNCGKGGDGDREGSVRDFDSWLAGRMVGDRLLRERMVRGGVVEEGVVVLNGLED